MFSLFSRKYRPAPDAPAAEPSSPAGYLTPQTAESLLATPRRQQLLGLIWNRTSVSRPQFDDIYLAPIHRYAELVQLLPASESHHHAYAGGLLDHGLEVVAYALKLRQAYLLPSGAPPEEQIKQSEGWTAALVYTSLCHDLGKIDVDIDVEYPDGRSWHPWHGPLNSPYGYKYRKDRKYRLHNTSSIFLAHLLLDSKNLNWLSSFPELYYSWLYSLGGQSEESDKISKIVALADQASVSHAVGGDPNKALSAPKHALQRKLLDGLRYLLGTELNINQPQASDGWLTQDALWLVSKTVSDKLRAHLLSHGIDGIPEKNTAVFNVLQEHGIALPAANGKAIWNATVTSEVGWSHSFTFLKLSPELIWDPELRPPAFTGTVVINAVETSTTSGASTGPLMANTEPAAKKTNTHTSAPSRSPKTIIESASPDSIDTLMDLFGGPPTIPDDFAAVPIDDYEPLIEPSREPTKTVIFSGEHFMAWLKQGVRTHRIIINDSQALVHTVNDTVFLVSPGIFKRYAQEHPLLQKVAKIDNQEAWEWIQKHFEKLKQHRRVNDLNICTCVVSGGRRSRRLHGYLLKSSSGLMNDLALNNPHLKVIEPEQ
ncbi:MobH family relaxase [Pseudomonas koreensis]|uniref:TraI domain-containing protein n=1 Tax=Pseudomonas koreensis TaxID=198620 RepID=A0A9X2XE94_9PSED|nr:MobH family relaxase [Pseudomonas koreensis]MCU7247305.1 TraI domain-containing protein [Pseudomonas koreensis]